MTTHTETKISPLPWMASKIDFHGQRMILGGPNGRYVATVQIYQTPRAYGLINEPERQANAEYLVRSANSFPALLAALEDDADYFYGKMMAAQETHDTEDFAEYTDRFNRASAAIAAAKAP